MMSRREESRRTRITRRRCGSSFVAAPAGHRPAALLLLLLASIASRARSAAAAHYRQLVYVPTVEGFLGAGAARKMTPAGTVSIYLPGRSPQQPRHSAPRSLGLLVKLSGFCLAEPDLDGADMVRLGSPADPRADPSVALLYLTAPRGTLQCELCAAAIAESLRERQPAAAAFSALFVAAATAGRCGSAWDATDACCQPEKRGRGAADVPYVLAAVRAALAALPALDPGRVALIGVSAGAFMAHRLACDAPQMFAGIGAFAGAGWADPSKCLRPAAAAAAPALPAATPASDAAAGAAAVDSAEQAPQNATVPAPRRAQTKLVLLGFEEDTIIPPEGGVASNGARYPSFNASLQTALRRNGCDPRTPPAVRASALPGLRDAVFAPLDRRPVTVRAESFSAGCRGDASVLALRVGAGHQLFVTNPQAVHELENLALARFGVITAAQAAVRAPLAGLV